MTKKAEKNPYRHIYPETCQPNTRDADPPVFPDKCPACGAAKTGEETAGPHYACWAEYACGGKYKHKSQIQNHTNIWWGSCPKVRAEVAAEGGLP
jgi:hypothetical protein